MTQDELDLLREELEMVEGLIHPFDRDAFLDGELTPVYFGCAINNFGLELFLSRFTELAPPPGPLQGVETDLPPDDPAFSAFIYKVQANMNPSHRDRMAFIRVATGKFEKNMTVKHMRTGKKIKLSFPYRLFGQKREIIEEAWPGDIVGLVNPGIFRVGDVLTTGKDFKVKAFPRFAPELFARVHLLDMSQNKGFRKGLQQLGEEGVVSVLKNSPIGGGIPVLAAVGQLQLEVFRDRMKAEYSCDVRLDTLEYTCSRWVDQEISNPESMGFPVYWDESDQPMALFRNEWHLNQVMSNEPDLKLLPHPPH